MDHTMIEARLVPYGCGWLDDGLRWTLVFRLMGYIFV